MKKAILSSSIHGVILAVWLGACTVAWGQSPVGYQAYQVPIPGFAANHSFKEVYQDHIGLLWIGTQDGLFVFDGNSAMRFNSTHAPLGTSEVFALAEDNKNRLWVSTQQGLFVLDPTREKTIQPNRLGIPDTLLLAPNFSLCQGPNKSLFILSGDQIYHWQNGQVCRWANAPLELRDATGAKLLFSLKDQSLFIQLHPLNSVWVVSEQGNIQKTQSTPPCTINQLNEDLILKFVFNYEFGLNLLSYDRTLKDFKHHNQPEDIEYQFLHPVREVLKQKSHTGTKDPGMWQIYPLQQDLWAVSCTEGLFLIHPTQQLFNNIPGSRNQRIRGIVADRYNHLIYGTHSGLYWWNPTNGQSQLIMDVDETIWSLVATDTTNDKFIASGEGFQEKFFSLKSTPQNVALDNVHVRTEIYMESMAILKDQGGRGFWYAQGASGIFNLKLLKPNGYEHHTMQPTIPVNHIRSIAQTDGIWLGTDKGLLYADVSESDSNTITLLTEKVPAALRTCYINVVQADERGNIWIGTRNQGLFYYKPNTKALTQYTTRDGLADNTVFGIVQTKGNIIWIGTGNGLSRLDQQRNWFQNYYVEDGLLYNEFNTAATHLAADGTIYMGGQNGINYFHPADFKTDTIFAPTYLAVRLDGNAADATPNQIYLTPQSHLLIKPFVDVLELSFRSASLIHAQSTYFRYRIPNLDTVWRYVNHADKAMFSGLPIGNHTLEVQCQSHRGMWGPTATYAFSVLPPWYKTWWFRTFLTLGIFSGLYGLYNLRIQFLRREFGIRQQVSYDLHDSIGSRMYFLRRLGQMITNPQLSEEVRRQHIHKFELASQDTFLAIRDLIWAFDPRMDEVSDLFDRMDDFAENYLSPLVPSVEVIRDTIAHSGYQVGHRIKYGLMNVYQELLTNMVKHTQPQRVQIRLENEGRKITIVITNYHGGIPASHWQSVPGNYGSESMAKRLAEINAYLVWQKNTGAMQQVAIYMLLPILKT